MEDPKRFYCTSVDDAKISIRRCTDVDVLDAALLGEKRNNNRASLVRALEQRIRRLKMEAESCQL